MADHDLRDVIYLDAPGFLGVDLRQLFGVLDRALTRYRAAPVKTIDDAFLLVLGLAHLREWIAPGYDHRMPARYPNQKFFNAIYEELESFRLLLAVANGAKHHENRQEIAVRSRHYDKIDDWPSFDAALSVDDGPVAEYHIEGWDLADLCQEVLEFYCKNWIALTDDERHGSLELQAQRVREESQRP